MDAIYLGRSDYKDFITIARIIVLCDKSKLLLLSSLACAHAGVQGGQHKYYQTGRHFFFFGLVYKKKLSKLCPRCPCFLKQKTPPGCSPVLLTSVKSIGALSQSKLQLADSLSNQNTTVTKRCVSLLDLFRVFRFQASRCCCTPNPRD